MTSPGVASMFASALLGTSGGAGGGLPNPLAGGATSSANTGDVGLGGFGDFTVATGGSSASGGGGALSWFVIAGGALLAAVLLLRR